LFTSGSKLVGRITATGNRRCRCQWDALGMIPAILLESGITRLCLRRVPVDLLRLFPPSLPTTEAGDTLKVSWTTCGAKTFMAAIKLDRMLLNADADKGGGGNKDV